jgi:hypothetical protein
MTQNPLTTSSSLQRRRRSASDSEDMRSFLILIRHIQRVTKHGFPTTSGGHQQKSLGHHLHVVTIVLRIRIHLPAHYNEQCFTGLSSCLVIVIFCGQTSSVRLPITFLTSWDTRFMVKELRAKRQSSCASFWCPATLYPVTGFSTSIFYAF